MTTPSHTHGETHAESRFLQKSGAPLMTILLLAGPVLMLAFILQVL
jgi:hypothetical protein